MPEAPFEMELGDVEQPGFLNRSIRGLIALLRPR